jgi:hypothetical protein
MAEAEGNGDAMEAISKNLTIRRAIDQDRGQDLEAFLVALEDLFVGALADLDRGVDLDGRDAKGLNLCGHFLYPPKNEW